MYETPAFYGRYPVSYVILIPHGIHVIVPSLLLKPAQVIIYGLGKQNPLSLIMGMISLYRPPGIVILIFVKFLLAVIPSGITGRIGVNAIGRGVLILHTQRLPGKAVSGPSTIKVSRRKQAASFLYLTTPDIIIMNGKLALSQIVQLTDITSRQQALGAFVPYTERGVFHVIHTPILE